jgi:hypothetical protein
MQDRPTAQELLEALRGFLERDVLPDATGRTRFHARVAVNVTRILERELSGEETAVRAEWSRLDALLGAEEPPATFGDLRDRLRARNTELAGAIRSGSLDDRWDDVVDAMAATVAEKLAIADPGYGG